MVYAELGGQTECIMGNWKIENGQGQGQPCPNEQSAEIFQTIPE